MVGKNGYSVIYRLISESPGHIVPRTLRSYDPSGIAPINMTSKKSLRFQFDLANVTKAPESIVSVVRQFLERDKPAEFLESRQHQRFAIAKVAIAVPLDEDFERLDDGFEVVVRDISTGGVGLYHTRAITAPYLAVQIRSDVNSTLSMVAKVMRCESQGRLYLVGCQFVAKIET